MSVLAPPSPVYELEPQQMWTLADFYALPEERPYHELDEGKLISMSSPSGIHQTIFSELIFHIMLYLRQNKIGKLWMEYNVQLSDSTVYIPDLSFVRLDSTSAFVDNSKIIGAPDLVVEILSPSTRNRDWNKKYIAYETHGVPFYWIIDPRDEMIWECKNTENGYVRTQIVELDEPFSPEIFPGLSFNLAQLMGRSPEIKEDN